MRRCLLAFALYAVATSSFAAIKTRPVEWKVGNDTFSGHLVYDDAVKKKLPGLVMFPNWMGVTDHSEYVGVVQQAANPDTALAKSALGKELQVKTPADVQRIYLMLGRTMTANQPIKAKFISSAITPQKRTSK